MINNLELGLLLIIISKNSLEEHLGPQWSPQALAGSHDVTTRGSGCCRRGFWLVATGTLVRSVPVLRNRLLFDGFVSVHEAGPQQRVFVRSRRQRCDSPNQSLTFHNPRAASLLPNHVKSTQFATSSWNNTFSQISFSYTSLSLILIYWSINSQLWLHKVVFSLWLGEDAPLPRSPWLRS